MCVHAEAKTKKLADKQWKEKMQRAYEKGIKQISMIDMASKEIRKLANKWEGKQANKKEDKQAKGKKKDGVHEGLM